MAANDSIHRVLVVDTETSGLDPERDRVVEIAVALWDVQYATTIATAASLIPGPAENAAAEINGISPALLGGLELPAPWDAPLALSRQADVILAHNASFDRGFVGTQLVMHTWIDSDADIEWPQPSPSRSLVGIALAHGVPVLSAHRALSDVQTLCRLLERCADLGHDVGAMLDAANKRALAPKFRYVSTEPYERKDDVKAAGFRWDPAAREWWRLMSEAQAAQIDGIRMRRVLEGAL